MTSKIKVDNINKVSDDSTIIKKCGSTTTVGSGSGNTVVVCGSTVTMGRCGGTVALASGATQTGFGRTGTVNWVTTKKTTGFTAVSGEGYFCDTAAVGAFTLTLPSSPSAGDIVGLKDYNGNFATANLTIGRGGSPINGGNAVDVVISTAGASIFLVYVDATQGWVATQDDESVFTGASFITATGGTITCVGDCKVHTFTGPGSFVVCSISSTASQNVVSYMVVAGGGGGGGSVPGGPSRGSGGGGAGGFREIKNPVTPYTASPLDGYPTPANHITVTAPTTFPVTVGGGGAGGGPGSDGSSGSNSNFSTITSAAGGFGVAGGACGAGSCAGSGGSGGGLGRTGPSPRTAGAGNTPPVSPPQGNAGGGPRPSGDYSAGAGGGGATSAGGGGPGNALTAGTGATTNIPGSPITKSTGGEGGDWAYSSPYPQAPLQPGTGAPGVSGPANSGTGGNGSQTGALPQPAWPGGTGGTGGSGIVVIRYRFQ